MDQYTELSQEAFEYATFPTLTPQEAADWVKNSSCFRTLPEKLMKFYSGTPDEMKTLLRNGLGEIHNSPKERESIRKNVNNWFSKAKGMDDRTISRNYAIEICFILKLSLEQADEFLRSVNGERLHYRNICEFIAAYGLAHGLSYDQYIELQTSIESEYKDYDFSNTKSEIYTRLSANALLEQHNEDELREYIREHKDEFSNYHNTSYAYFTDMMKVLKNGGTDASVRELVTDNLYRKFVRKSKKLSAIAKSICAGWPDETSLSRIKSRELEVNRKLLILLYLASGGEVDRTDAWNEDDLEAFTLLDDAVEDEGESADFEAMRSQIDAMLVESGFAPLDPRLPFDWMVLFCMATGDLFDLDDRFEGFLTTMFGNEIQD